MRNLYNISGFKNMKCIIIFLVILVLPALSCSGYGAQNKSEPFSHPITITDGKLILLDVCVADKIDATFILDTGAGIHVLSSSLLTEISSVEKGRFIGFRHTGERVDFDILKIESLSIGDFHQKNPIIAVWQLLDEFDIDGILSMKFFEDYPFTLNLRDSLLIFETPISIKARTKASKVTTLKVSDVRDIKLDIFVDIILSDSLVLECILDSGSPATIIDARYASYLGIDTTKVQRRERQSLFGATEIEYITSIPSMSIHNIPGTEIIEPQIILKSNLIYDGLIGTNILIGRKLTFDIPNRQLFIETD